MAFDGITVAAIVSEMQCLIGTRIYKIAQPEPDELLITFKGPDGTRKLLISAGASLPLLYFTGQNKTSPLTAPNFCMLLRKHLQNGRITSVEQPDLERIVRIGVEHLNEMGDLCRKIIIVELMGKYSNIIFCDEDETIIDSIKRISGLVSSVREVLPGKKYFVADTQHKLSPLCLSRDDFEELISQKAMPVYKALYTGYTGISPTAANEICYRAGIDGEASTVSLSGGDRATLYRELDKLMEQVRKGQFVPAICYTAGKPVEYEAFPLTMYCGAEDELKEYSTISETLEIFYAEKEAVSRIRQRSVDLRKIVNTVLERNVRKYELQCKQMKDTEKRDTYRIYGELINTYGYGVPAGAKSFEALNYYTDETIVIPLDPTLTALENAQKYFDQYGKLKRTYEALAELTVQAEEEILHLRSVVAALDMAASEDDLNQIREELVQSGYIKRGNTGKKVKLVSKPLHYISSDGYDMYVGKNNFQNEELTFKVATGGDWWFHAKGTPGSHVIVKTRNGEEMPDATFEEAARLAAFYSTARDQGKAEVDYVRRKEVKKPAGGKPGFVVYYTNYSMTIEPNIDGIKSVQ